MTLKNTGLNGYNYDFSVGYAIEVADILEIHMYLTRKRHSIKCLNLRRTCLFQQ